MRKRPLALKYWFEKDAFLQKGVNGTVLNEDWKIINHGGLASVASVLSKLQFVCKQMSPSCAHTV